jgi:uroporphyrin-III C-methyltransferase/precorrin-2 dehydrogenase/sirohydrochlorin ferrochelatase
VIANGTRPDQRVETGTLRQLEMLAARLPDAPLMLVIGEVVRHADAWTGSQTAQAVAG